MAWTFVLSRPTQLRSFLTLNLATFSFSTSSTKPPQHKSRKRKEKRPRTELVQSDSTRIPILERLVERDSFFKFLTKSKEFLCKQPEHALCLEYACKLHNELGFLRGRNVVHSIRRHPLIFETYRNRDGKMWFRFTDFMEELLEEERAIMNSMVMDRVNTVRKLLMMSVEKRIPLSKIHHCRFIFGIPDDFKDRIAKYPDYFRIVDDENGRRVLELVNWDSTLAVSALQREFMVDEGKKVKRISGFLLKRGMDLNLDENDKRKLNSLNTLPLVSPYSDGSKLDRCSLESEKYRAGVLHEFLSLTLEKKAYVHHIVEFKEEFGLSKHIYQMLLKQPKIFYVAGTVKNWVVFLKDGYYENGILIKKDPLVVFNERLYSHAQM